MASPFVYKDLMFPLAGLNRKYAIQSQPPYTTPDAVNVRPETLPDKRCRGGSRPGVNKYLDDQMDGKVNMLAYIKGARYEAVKEGSGGSGSLPEVIPGIEGSFPSEFYDDFNGTGIRLEHWQEIGSLGFPFVNENPRSVEQYMSKAGAAKKTIEYDASKPYSVAMYVARPFSVTNKGVYTLYLGLNNSSPNENQGISAVVQITDSGTSVYGRVGSYNSFTSESSATYGELKIRVSSGKAKISFAGMECGTINVGVLTGTMFGFTLLCEEEGSTVPIDYFKIDYYLNAAIASSSSSSSLSSDSSGSYSSDSSYSSSSSSSESAGYILNRYADILVASANGKLYRESPKGCLQHVNSESIQTEQKNRYVMAVARNLDLFVADYRSMFEGRIHKVSGYNGSITTGGVLSSIDITDWTKYNLAAGSDVVILTNADTGVAVGNYLLQAIATNGITLNGYDGGAGNTVFAVDVSPKKYNSDTNTYSAWMAEKGDVPTNCQLICLYRDRLVFAGADDNPHLWYMSRQGDPYDWNYVEDTSSKEKDYGIAVAGNNSDAGTIGRPIRALIPHSDDYLVFGYDTEMWVLRGDPAANGSIDCMSREVGIVGKRAWCYGEQGEIYFLSKKGIYMLSSGYTTPKKISTMKIPNELNGYGIMDNVQMVYDHDWHGVHLFIEGETTQWFFDIENIGFWKIEFSNGMDVVSVLRLDEKTLMGCTDGYIRMYDMKAVGDDGQPFTSRVLIGPIRPATSDYANSVVQKILGTFDGSDFASKAIVNIYSGIEPEDAWMNYECGQITSSFELRIPITTQLERIRAAAIIIEIVQEGQMEWWGLERLGLYAKKAGRFKED